ncbi:hypothetical protein KY289_020780 [Solanum tuberosum]|nr:hypothetical protein KY289_020780 [Solanum tuberosum]
MHNYLLELENKILHELEKWSNIEENALKKKSRAKWIQLGDGNNHYFSAIIKERVHRKQLLELTSPTGTVLSGQREIREEILLFYKSLMGSATTTLPAVNNDIMKRGPVLSHQQGLKLCKPVTEEEIYSSLMSISDDKASGVDGFNDVFYKKSCSLVKEEVFQVIRKFFTTGNMHKDINCTSITLVPKIASPTSVKEYRPTACCTVLYKTIAKILAARLHEVITSVISEAQSGFIPGRKIANNIILATELVKDYQRKNTSPRCMIKIDLQKAYDSVQ